MNRCFLERNPQNWKPVLRKDYTKALKFELPSASISTDKALALSLFDRAFLVQFCLDRDENLVGYGRHEFAEFKI